MVWVTAGASGASRCGGRGAQNSNWPGRRSVQASGDPGSATTGLTDARLASDAFKLFQVERLSLRDRRGRSDVQAGNLPRGRHLPASAPGQSRADAAEQTSPTQTGCGSWSLASPRGTFRGGAWPWLPTAECVARALSGLRAAEPTSPGGEAPAALPRRAGARKGAWAPRRASLGGPERRRAPLARSLLPPLGRFPSGAARLCRTQSEHCVVR